MLKVGGFPEFEPMEQNIFDKIIDLIEKNYKSWGYIHIYTPAVERNKVLLAKWWEEVSKQIFGLYWLAQWCEKDTKDYSLHFDLTVPFARYVLDHIGQLTFPFKRYQIQPVWRGERQQKWRFREFWQADIDVIWKKSDADEYLWYDVEVISLLMITLVDIFKYFDINKKLILRINNKKIVEWLLQYFKKVWFSEKFLKWLVGLLDKYHKISEEEFRQQLKKLVLEDWRSEAVFEKLEEIGRNRDKLEKELEIAKVDIYFSWRAEAELVVSNVDNVLQKFWISDKIQIVLDTTIVRWLDYYTWTVFETFVEWVENLGSICSWGRYEGLTGYIEPKYGDLDGVGGSIGVNRLFDWLKDEIDIKSFVDESYLIINFGYGKLFEKAVELMQKLIWQWKKVQIFPYPEKIKKQFKYADKNNIKYVITLGEEELQKGIYKIKNMFSWKEIEEKLPN